jgi:hypothetical protein
MFEPRGFAANNCHRAAERTIHHFVIAIPSPAGFYCTPSPKP